MMKVIAPIRLYFMQIRPGQLLSFCTQGQIFLIEEIFKEVVSTTNSLDDDWRFPDTFTI
jgi:hypothetical protein